jgi:Uma2 family endonuclease
LKKSAEALPMATDTETLPSAAEPAPTEPDGLYEVVDGQIVEKTLGAYECYIADLLIALLLRFVEERGSGRIHSEMLFLIDAARGLKRRPDVAFLSRERWSLDQPPPLRDAWDVIPDLAIEVVSPSNSASEVMLKVTDYFQAGVRLVWVVYPLERLVQVFESASTSQIISKEGILEGGAVLPGFQLPLATLFAHATPHS